MELTPEEGIETRRLDAEIEENFRRMEEKQARRERLASFIAAWERRGERFDRVLDRIEKLLDRHERTAGE